jgi:hypothetical protein
VHRMTVQDQKHRAGGVVQQPVAGGGHHGVWPTGAQVVPAW